MNNKLTSQQGISSRPLEETYQLIDQLDLRIIKAKLCASSGGRDRGFNWPKDEADLAVQAYRGFLKILAKSHYDDKKCGAERRMVMIQSPDKNTPTPVVDIVWHTHILFTRKYMADCKNIFGYYLHHLPTVTLNDEEGMEQQSESLMSEND